MEKCYIPNCMLRALATCACEDPKIYICKNHMIDHIEGENDSFHNIEKILMYLTSARKENVLQCSLESIKNIKHIKENIKFQTNNVIKQVSISCNSILTELSSLESKFMTLIQNINSNEKVDKRFVAEYKDLCISDSSNQFNNLLSGFLGHIHDVYSTKLTTERLKLQNRNAIIIPQASKNDDNKVFYCSDSLTELKSIDLVSMTVSNLKFGPKCCRFFQSCRLDGENFFINGGENNNKTYIINFDSKSYKQLAPSSYNNHGAACILQGRIIHIFGGVSDNNSKCQGYDIVLKEWVSLASLPQPSFYNTAAIFQDKIIVSGYYLSNLYAYIRNTFTDILPLASSVPKIVCDGWIIAGKSIYEYSNDLKAWIIHKSRLTTCSLSSIVFCKGSFIYYIDDKLRLIRLDKINKKLEVITFGCESD